MEAHVPPMVVNAVVAFNGVTLGTPRDSVIVNFRLSAGLEEEYNIGLLPVLPILKEITPAPFICQGRSGAGLIIPSATYGFQLCATENKTEKMRIPVNRLLITFTYLIFV